MNNWGTEWDCPSAKVSTSRNHIKITFSTAWSTPEQWLRRASEKLPTLTFTLTYAEPSLDFYGELVCKGGKKIGGWENSVGTNALDLDDPRAGLVEHMRRMGLPSPFEEE
jgi:hypothetical protein